MWIIEKGRAQPNLAGKVAQQKPLLLHPPKEHHLVRKDKHQTIAAVYPLLQGISVYGKFPNFHRLNILKASHIRLVPLNNNMLDFQLCVQC